MMPNGSSRPVTPNGDNTVSPYGSNQAMSPNGNNAWKQDAEYLDEIIDDLSMDLQEVLPPGADIRDFIAKIGELREQGRKVLQRSALARASITVPAGTTEDVTVELFTDEDGDVFLSVADKQMDLVRISGGSAGPVAEGRRLVRGA